MSASSLMVFPKSEGELWTNAAIGLAFFWVVSKLVIFEKILFRFGFGGKAGVCSNAAMLSPMSSKLKPFTAEKTFSFPSERDGVCTKDIVASLSSCIVSNVCNVEKMPPCL